MQDPKQTPATVRRRLKTIHIIRTAQASPAVMASGPEELLPLITALYEPFDANKEHFITLALNARNRVIGWHHVSTGSINASIVHPRELFSAMLRLDAVSIILVHNHPSGDVDPSQEDISLTNRLERAADLLGMVVVDHIIVGPIPEEGLPVWLSFKQKGML